MRLHPHPDRPTLVLALSLLLAIHAIASWAPAAWAGEYCPEYVGSLAKEVASADFNGDGLADFAVTIEPNAVAIVLGQAGARPTHYDHAIPTGAAVQGIAAGDLNDDGLADLLVAQPSWNAVRVLLGHGDGTFSYSDPIDGGTNPYRLALGDLDGDGDLDVAILSGLAAPAANELSILFNLGDGTFGPRTAIDLSAYPSDQDDIAAGDVDGDGDDDVVVLRRGIVSSTVVKSFLLARSNGDGTFAFGPILTESASSSAIALADVNHDGRADLVARDGDLALGGPLVRQLSTYMGRADGTFDAPVRAAMANFLAGRLVLSDMNGDGELDAVMTAGPGFALVAGCGASAVGLALGNGAGNFTAFPQVPSGGAFSTSVAVGDADGDGRPDVATAGYECGTLVLNPGNGDGTLRVLTHSARAFTEKNKDVIRLNSNKSNWCLSFESVGGNFDVTSEAGMFSLNSAGTGTVGSIFADVSKPIVVGDADNNGVPDVTVCFTKDRLRQLFANLNGRQTVAVTVRAEIGRPTCFAEAILLVDVLPGGNNAAASLRRRPGGDGWVLSYAAERSGVARIRLFDVRGRLVRDLGAHASVEGANEVAFDGRTENGPRLPAGVYFVRVDQGQERRTGKLVLMR